MRVKKASENRLVGSAGSAVPIGARVWDGSSSVGKEGG